MEPLHLDKIDPDPIRQFVCWLHEAEQASIPLPNAMTLATVNQQGRPSARMLLLKNVDDLGFVFYTNYESRKAQDLRGNSAAALVFWWQPLSRQVRVEGEVEQMTPAESDRYFATRPRGHQLATYASCQSQVITGRTSMELQFLAISKKFEGQDVPRPPQWGGYRVIPNLLEFWQEGQNRLHDRIRYQRKETHQWFIERLAP